MLRIPGGAAGARGACFVSLRPGTGWGLLLWRARPGCDAGNARKMRAPLPPGHGYPLWRDKDLAPVNPAARESHCNL